MYLGFYGLQKEPFHVTPDPEFLFPSPSHKEAFAALVYGVDKRKGFVVLTGEVGTGKTTVLRSYLQQTKRDVVRPMYIFNPVLTFEELLRYLIGEMGCDEEVDGTAASMLNWLHRKLIDEYEAGHNIVLIIDEAQNMPVDTIEQLRMLSNLETTREKLLQIVLVGQPELEEKLALHSLRQLRQRVAVRANVRALTAEEALSYMQHRVSQAGGSFEPIFSPAAVKTIIRYAKGNPRTLNILCDNLLLAGFGNQERPIGKKLVREVIRDLSGHRVRRAKPWRWAPLGAAAMLAVGFAVFQAVEGQDGKANGQPSKGNGVAHARGLDDAQGQSAAVAGDGADSPESAAASQGEAGPGDEDAGDAQASEPAVRVARIAPAGAAEAADDLAEKKLPGLKTNYFSFEDEPGEAKEAAEDAEGDDPAGASDGQQATDADAKPAEAARPLPKLDLALDLSGRLQLDSPLAAGGGAAEEAKEMLFPAGVGNRGQMAMEDPMMVREVRTGDSLSKIVAEVYGENSPSVMRTVQALNPSIKDPNLIFVGDKLVLPQLEPVVSGDGPEAP